MSHFTVLVIGDHPAQQLAPYDENLEDCQNPKWDWYQLGGRWTGFFLAKPGCHGITGEAGIMTEVPEIGWYDAMRKGDIDFQGMRQRAANKAGQRWDSLALATAGLPRPQSWDALRAQHDNIDAARVAYRNQPYIVAAAKAGFHDIDPYQVPRDEFTLRAWNRAISTFAVVKDGEWYERGEMGWWACVSNEKPEAQWETEFQALLEAVPDDTLLSVFDCHI